MEQNNVEELIIRTESYVKTTVELSKLKVLENTGTVASSMVATVVAAVIFLLGLLIASFGASFYLGEILGKVYYGFFVVAGAYFVIGIFFYFFLNNRIKKSVNESLREKLFS